MLSSRTWEYTVWWSWIKNLLGRVTSVEFTFKKVGKNLSIKLTHYFFYYYFFSSGFFLQTFTIHRTPGEGGVYLFNFSLSLPPASQTAKHESGFTAESSPLHIASSRTQTKKSNFFQSDSTKENRGFHFYQIISSNKLLIPKERLLLLLIFS